MVIDHFYLVDAVSIALDITAHKILTTTSEIGGIFAHRVKLRTTPEDPPIHHPTHSYEKTEM